MILRKEIMWQCPSCQNAYYDGQLLVSRNPFGVGEVIGCPDCEQVVQPIRLCDVLNCGAQATVGTKNGWPRYVFVCSKHNMQRGSDAV